MQHRPAYVLCGSLLPGATSHWAMLKRATNADRNGKVPYGRTRQEQPINKNSLKCRCETHAFERLGTFASKACGVGRTRTTMIYRGVQL